jgi:lysophospholipase L1-like esterase
MADSRSKRNRASRKKAKSPQQRQPRPRARGSKRRTWIFRIAALLFPIACVVLANASLYLADVGVDTSLVVSNDRLPDGTSYLNPQADLAYFREDVRGPEPRSFALPKEPDTFRVLVIGASSVQGFPYHSELSFPRQMELALGRQFEGEKVEVLNAGVVGLSTTTLVDVVAQAVGASPDVIVVYTGHNEFYGVGGVASNATIGRLGILSRRFRLVQALSNWRAEDDAASGELISRLPNDLEIRIGSESFAEAEQTYKKNLTKIANTCSRAEIPLVMCSVVSNLRNQSPVRSASDAILVQADRQLRDQLDQKVKPLIEQEQFAAAHESLQDAKELLSKCAVIQYRQAQCLEGLGKATEAGESYALARDLDGCRFRAPSSFGEIVRQVALQAADDEVYFVNLVPIFAAASQHAAPGHDLFLDHVHFTPDGGWLIATTISKAIVEEVRDHSWNADAVPSDSERDTWLGVSTEDHLVAVGMAFMLLQQPPFDRSIDADFRSVGTMLDRYLEELPEEEKRLFMSLTNDDKMADLVNALGRLRLSMGDARGALALFERGKIQRPWRSDAYVFAAICHYHLNRKSEAAANLEKSSHTPLIESVPILQLRDDLVRQLEL